MTAIAGAIRVQGHKFLKAFIGRARENEAAAEIEYMSSTSAEVGELFNGRGIVRTMGQPEIAQFIVFPDELLKEKRGAQNQSYGIHTSSPHLKKAFYTRKVWRETCVSPTKC
jgi:hypothetical protein